MKMVSLNKKILKKIVSVMASGEYSDVQTLQFVSSLVGDQSLAIRAVEWLPEAFGYVLISRIPGVALPTTFHVKDAGGTWHELPFTAEPLVRDAVELGAEIVDSGLGDEVAKLSLRSSIVAAVNSALNSGTDLSDAKISGPAFVKLSASIYLSSPV